jgi:imidazolonepropionase-like amidohydrolase
MSILPNTSTLILADKLIDGKGGPTIEDGGVLLSGSKIKAVGRRLDLFQSTNDDVTILDFTGKTIMPGMVDTHTHHTGFGDGRSGDDLAELPNEILVLQAAKNARAALYSGVTSARENGAKDYTTFKLRQAIHEGITEGPRLVLCGPPLSTIGGHLGYFGGEITGQTEARAMVRRHVKEGADYIKITATGGTTKTSFPWLSSLNVDELTAITDEAHRFGKLTATHCLSTQGIINSLDADVDMIIHCIFNNPDGSSDFRKDVAERIGEQGAYVNPTLHVLKSRIWSLLKTQESRTLTPQEKLDLDDRKRFYDIRLEHCHKLIEMGLKIVTGSDSSWGDYKLGNTPYETECLVTAGLSPMEGIVSVTSEAANSIGIGKNVGTLEADKEADILILGDDPSQDITALWNIESVFQSGRKLDRGSELSREIYHQYPPRTIP